MKYRIYAQRIFSIKWAESVAFYKNTIGLPIKFESEEMGWAEFDLGGASLAVEKQDPVDPETQSLVGRFVGISIEVENIEAIYLDLTEKGVRFLNPPKKQPWGGVLAHFNDPDNNTITLLDTAQA